MIDSLTTLFEQSPMLALFVVIGLGYALGQISIGGFSLGVGAVLFAGIAVGAIAPKATPPGMVSSIGLIMFLYGIGIQYGTQFFKGLRGAGLKWNLLALVGVLFSLAVALGLGKASGVSVLHSIGLFAGALTSTPTLQAAIEAAGNRDPAIGYSVAYPFGVIGPILCIFAFAKFFTPRRATVTQSLQALEITLGNSAAGTVADLLTQLPPAVDLIAIRHGDVNRLPDASIQISPGDAVMLYGAPAALEQARLALGSIDPGRLTKDRGALDMARLFVSRPAIVGTSLSQMQYPEGIVAKIAEVRRGDAVIFPAPELVLEYGDRVGVIAARESLPSLRKHFGDSLKSTAEFSYVSVGLGMSLGVLLGLIKVPIPGVGSFSLGLAGGPLIVALILGRLGRFGAVSWRIPLAANLTLRNFGLTLFLAAVGMGAGAPFVETVSRTGFTLLGIGAVILLAAMLCVMFLGHYVFKLTTEDMFGIASGASGNPAILAFANRTMPSDRIDVAFATIFPSMTIVKIICAQVSIGLLR